MFLTDFLSSLENLHITLFIKIQVLVYKISIKHVKLSKKERFSRITSMHVCKSIKITFTEYVKKVDDFFAKNMQ